METKGWGTAEGGCVNKIILFFSYSIWKIIHGRCEVKSCNITGGKCQGWSGTILISPVIEIEKCILLALEQLLTK